MWERVLVIDAIFVAGALGFFGARIFEVARDKGHRLGGVPSEAARAAIVRVLEVTTDLKEYGTMDFGKSHQTVMRDGYTVIHHLEGGACSLDLSGTGMSHIVKDPMRSAEKAMRILKNRGFEAVLEDGAALMGMKPNLLVLVKSNATCGWPIVYRRHRDELPKPKWR